MREGSGFFIAIEGSDGIASSAISLEVAAHFRRLGHAVVVTSDAAASAFASKVLELVGDAGTSLDPVSASLLLTAARRELISTVIAPALARDEIVICNQFIHSMIAELSGLAGVTADVALTLHAQVCDDLWPDLTVLLEAEPSSGGMAGALRRTMSYTPDGDYGIIDAAAPAASMLQRTINLVSMNDRFESYSAQRQPLKQWRAA